jgi:hypothetical protein
VVLLGHVVNKAPRESKASKVKLAHKALKVIPVQPVLTVLYLARRDHRESKALQVQLGQYLLTGSHSIY